MKHWRQITVLLWLLTATFSTRAFAQFSSAIEGTVKDSTGAAVAGATVTVTDTRLNVSKTTTTNQTGYFRIESLAASTYTVEVKMEGFQTWTAQSLALQIAEIRSISAELKIGSVAANITVSAAETSVDLTTATTGSIISDETLRETPLSGQNIYSLSALTPGMTGAGVSTANNDNYTNEYAININASGLRQEQNGYQIDDAYTNTPSRGGGTSISPNPEIVQSVDIRTNDFDAQKGRNGGATVDVYTNSGSNDFHGTMDYYFTNNSLSATTHFQNPVPVFTRNEMGATMGGPIVRNKLFWYGAIDFLRSSFASGYTATVETQDFYNWVQSNLPNTVGAEVLKMAPPQTYATANLETVAAYETATPGYFAPPAGIPSTLNVIGTTTVSYSTPKNGYQWSFRIDDYLGKKDRLYVDVMRTEYTSAQNGTRPNMDGGLANSSDFINVNWTHTFNDHLLNQTGANLIRPYGSDLGFAADSIPYVNVTNLAGFGTWAPGNFTQGTYGWHDVMTATVKTHTLKFGADLFNIREVDHQDGAFDRPTFNFNSILDFVQDEATSESATPVNLLTHSEAPYDREYRALYMGYFIQDDWKVSQRLTVNAGIRWDTMVNFFSILSPKLTNFTLGSGATENAQIADGVAILANSKHVLDHNIGGVTPRVGFSWDVFGKGRTAVRGGFGMFEDQPPYLHITDITAGNLPNFYTPSISVYSGQPTPTFQLCSPSSGWDEACPVVDTSNVTLNSSGGVEVNGVVQRAGMGGYSPNYKMTQVEEWTLSLQQQLHENLILEANYSASAAHHLPIFNQDLNRFAGDLIVNKGTLARLNPNFGDINYATSDGNSIGHYGSLALARTLSHGFALRGIYTLGKTLDTISNAVSLDSGSITSSTNVIQSQNLAAQRGRADFDIHQQVTADGTWTVPSHYNSVLARNVLGGWQFGGVWILQSGLPFTVYTSAPFNAVYDDNGNVVGNTGGDYNADGSNYDVPNVPSFGRHLSGKKKSDFLNGLFTTADFPTPTLGSEGSLGRNTYDQPGYNICNFNFEKFFSTPWFFGEKLKFEAKGEVFNLFNRVNLWTVSSDMSSSSFGTSTNQLPARSFQLHLRASF